LPEPDVPARLTPADGFTPFVEVGPLESGTVWTAVQDRVRSFRNRGKASLTYVIHLTRKIGGSTGAQEAN
jgi:hypothetical protein